MRSFELRRLPRFGLTRDRGALSSRLRNGKFELLKNPIESAIGQRNDTPESDRSKNTESSDLNESIPTIECANRGQPVVQPIAELPVAYDDSKCYQRRPFHSFSLGTRRPHRIGLEW